MARHDPYELVGTIVNSGHFYTIFDTSKNEAVLNDHDWDRVLNLWTEIEES